MTTTVLPRGTLVSYHGMPGWTVGWCQRGLFGAVYAITRSGITVTAERWEIAVS